MKVRHIDDIFPGISDRTLEYYLAHQMDPRESNGPWSGQEHEPYETTWADAYGLWMMRNHARQEQKPSRELKAMVWFEAVEREGEYLVRYPNPLHFCPQTFVLPKGEIA